MSVFDIELEQRAFRAALQEVLDVSEPLAARDVITRTGSFVVRRLVARTPELTAFMKLARRIVRAVYKKRSQRAVMALMEGRGHPRAVSWFNWAKQTQSFTKMGWAPSWRLIGNSGLPRVRKPGQQQEGSFIDNRTTLGTPSVAMVNHVSFVEKIDARKQIVASALNKQTEAMDKWLNTRYARMMKRHSGK